MGTSLVVYSAAPTAFTEPGKKRHTFIPRTEVRALEGILGCTYSSMDARWSTSQDDKYKYCIHHSRIMEPWTWTWICPKTEDGWSGDGAGGRGRLGQGACGS